MPAITKHGKPNDVVYAEIALWVWTVWACLFGIYQTWKQIPEIEDMLNTYLQDMISIAPDTMLHWAIGGYALVAVVSAFFIVMIGRGKHWARSSFLWGFICEVLIAFCPPYHTPMEYLGDIPDYGMQIFALYYLYTPRSKVWFGDKVAKQ